MSTAAPAVRQAIEAVVDTIESDTLTPADRLFSLPIVLDALASAVHGVTARPDGKTYPDCPPIDYQSTYLLVGEHFRTLGYYHTPISITRRSAESSVRLADAIDDITDILGDLKRVLWRWEHTSPTDALWHFRERFTTHWGLNLRALQLYLHVLAYEAGDDIEDSEGGEGSGDVSGDHS